MPGVLKVSKIETEEISLATINDLKTSLDSMQSKIGVLENTIKTLIGYSDDEVLDGNIVGLEGNIVGIEDLVLSNEANITALQ